MCVTPQVYCGLLCVLYRVLCEKNQNFAAALNLFIILAALTCFYDIALSSLEEWRLGHDLICMIVCTYVFTCIYMHFYHFGAFQQFYLFGSLCVHCLGSCSPSHTVCAYSSSELSFWLIRMYLSLCLAVRIYVCMYVCMYVCINNQSSVVGFQWDWLVTCEKVCVFVWVGHSPFLYVSCTCHVRTYVRMYLISPFSLPDSPSTYSHTSQCLDTCRNTCTLFKCGSLSLGHTCSSILSSWSVGVCRLAFS